MGREHESDEETIAVGSENKPLLRSRFSNMDSVGNEPREPQLEARERVIPAVLQRSIVI